MNLLDKGNFLIKSGLVLLLIPFFFACQDPDELGVKVSSDNQNVTVSDTTITLPLSTILIDSLRTNQFASLLVGNMQDSVTGTVACTGYTQYSPGTGTFPGDTLEYVSANIKLKIIDARTTTNMLNGHIDIHESNDTLYNQVVYLADREIEYNPTPIAQIDYNINIDQDSIITIPLNDLGQDLFDQLVKYNTDTLFKDSLDRSLLYYQPLVLNTTSVNTGLMALSLSNDSSAIFIEMKSPTSDSTYYYKFNFVSRGHFTHIERDRAGSKLASLVDEYIDEYGNGYAYGSMVDGVYAKVDMKPLKEFLSANENIIINNSRISMTITDYSSEFIVPFNSIRYYYIKKGRINGPIGSSRLAAYTSTILSNSSYSSSSADFLSMVYQDDTPNYSGEVTLFTQIYADDALGIDMEEMVVLSSTPTSIRQTIFTGAEVTVFYTLVNK
ncbi:MAG: hypothetical protein ACFHWX_22110 [Bacteroidota bacterium]